MTDLHNTLAMVVIAVSMVTAVGGIALVGSAVAGFAGRRTRTGSRVGECRQEVCQQGGDGSPPHPAEPDCGWHSGR